MVLGGPYRIPGIEPGPVAYVMHALPAVLSLPLRDTSPFGALLSSAYSGRGGCCVGKASPDLESLVGGGGQGLNHKA